MKHLNSVCTYLAVITLAPLSFAAYPRAGYEAQLSTLAHGVSGTVTIVDADTLVVENFNYDGGGPAVYFYLGTENTQAAFIAGIPIGPLQSGTVYTNDELVLHLPGPQTFDGYHAISVWCVDFNANFGSATFVKVNPDVAWVFDNNGTTSYVLDSASANIAPIGTEDPTIFLELGNRYQVKAINFGSHPFEVIAKGATNTGDTVLLSAKTGVVGSMETDEEIAWADDGAGTVGFTLTPSMVTAMDGTVDQNPGYRCGVHVDVMRGNFMICQGKPFGDLDNNCVVNLLDWSLFAQNWLANGVTFDDDLDGDGFISSDYGGYDCDDDNPNIHPAALEILGNGEDENCNGTIDDLEICDNGIDDDADGDIDCDDSDCNVFPDCLP